jgi:hypothetical protein
LITLAGVLLLLAACEALSDLNALRLGLQKEFESAVSVNLTNDRYLAVVFENSEAANLAETERAAFARRVADYVRDNYSSFQQLEEVSVGFRSTRRIGPVGTQKSSAPYVFKRDELAEKSQNP